MPFVIALGVLVIELTPAHFIYTGPLLVATPALAAVAMGPGGTTSAVALALVISVTTATYNQAWGTLQVYTNFLALALVSTASFITSSAVRAYRQSELDQVHRIAVAAQEVILRPVPERLGPVRAASLCLAAGTGAQVGGDLYEAVQTRYGVRMIVGDVRGKGLSAMRAVSVALGAFRVVAHCEDELMEVMNHCADALRREAAVPGAYGEEVVMEGFTTALMAQVPDDAVVQLVNRGHPPPLLLHQGRVQALMPSSPQPPLGLEDLITGPPAKPESYPFVPGDRLLLYTDGVIEARNRDDDFFDLREAMERIGAGTTPAEFLHELHKALIRHTGGRLADDVAMILVDRLDDEADEQGGGAAAAARG
ncbi:PP2C family protein-serine/threonine phosphatase [Streptomyces sp. PSKA30]|uniref:PP2C family protein-serine/threonine phosphatase n=1 Tax=Streptomyces sp. PSKA30 TaxID=2874597 RepID=UPI001CD16996|nr:PP2C family protein-serine/threonine phosphatase [Streptomyces sp. PSKA30]MBZ9638482.1 serine/threonine-protein phosphatase [Streptomyces sp. PSKA30]